MDESSKTLHVDLDGHKDSIGVAYAPTERAADVVALGTMTLGSTTSTSRSGRCKRRAPRASSRTKPGRAAIGCIAT
jgi:hypothetical protein